MCDTMRGLIFGFCLGNLMKSAFILVSICLVYFFQPQVLWANEVKDQRAKAAQYYSQQDFKKAYKIYFSLAKSGDHYSQNKLSQMYIAGDGVTSDLNEAYAWSVLVAESGVEGMAEKSDVLLQKTNDQVKAQKRAEKLKAKYGKQVLKEKADRKATRQLNHQMGGCTGSKLGCSKG